MSSHLHTTTTPPQFATLTQLLGSLQSFKPAEPSSERVVISATQHRSSNAELRNLSPEDTEKARSLFLTLHVLFPHHLLPALDLLDRGLVTRMTPATVKHAEGEETSVDAGGNHDLMAEASSTDSAWEVYYVQSSSAVTMKPHPQRRKSNVSAKFYEVRLDAWNCSCPAFSVDAFHGLMNPHGPDRLPAEQRGREELGGRLLGAQPFVGTRWRFGGIDTLPAAGRTPVCKHMLAAVLALCAPRIFGNGVIEKNVDRTELAGWGGGWGEFGYG